MSAKFPIAHPLFHHDHVAASIALLEHVEQECLECIVVMLEPRVRVVIPALGASSKLCLLAGYQPKADKSP